MIPLHPCRMNERGRAGFYWRAPDKSFTIRVALVWADKYAVVLHACPSGYDTRAQRLAKRLQLRTTHNGDLLLSGAEANAFIEAYASNFDAVTA